jgi:hypothetical protein
MLGGRKTLSSLNTGQARAYFMTDHISKKVTLQAPKKGCRLPVGVPEQGEAVAQGGRAPLLYLNSNNCLESNLSILPQLSPYHRKQAFCLSDNCERFIALVGLSRVGFLTLTFPYNVTDNKIASQRFASLNKNFLSRFFGAHMLVKERQKRGAWHYHILIDCRVDIRTGINWDDIHPAAGRPKYTSACPALRSIWSILRERLPAFGFGRSELLPIRTTAEATSKYLGKYISKHIGAREDRDKGVRLTSYSADFPKSTPKLSWNTIGGKEWRRKAAKFATLLGHDSPFDLQSHYGPSWAFKLQEYIMAVDDYSREDLQYLKRSFLRGLSDVTTVLPSHAVQAGNLVDLSTGEVLF